MNYYKLGKTEMLMLCSLVMLQTDILASKPTRGIGSVIVDQPGKEEVLSSWAGHQRKQQTHHATSTGNRSAVDGWMEGVGMDPRLTYCQRIQWPWLKSTSRFCIGPGWKGRFWYWRNEGKKLQAQPEIRPYHLRKVLWYPHSLSSHQ